MASYDDELVAAFARNERRIKRYLISRTRSHADADDLAQEAWIKLARNGAAALTAPVPYLMRIARTLAVDHDRGQKRKLTSGDIDILLSVPDEQPGPEKQIEDRDQIRCLMHIMDELPERQRKMLVACRLEQRRHADIAAEFGVSVRTVELEIRKAVDYCSERLETINRA
ncbi:RNA polymerase subunit sigma [Rhizobium sp. Root73]|uniref:RNA polymerase sigma factor n=1 Tax=unclassified Rhizobium TaxID=2613769 RepID=UPI000726D62F|nr:MULTISPECIES: RNA polymerase sigma factor [unclassified Rhizobium]KQY14878.1 RNA polymerase subunit sigma [Rhizobium sp. Root1334]KRC06316.1 RNA polymerase subunit sigma [Rhizobium sp. Root73]